MLIAKDLNEAIALSVQHKGKTIHAPMIAVRFVDQLDTTLQTKVHGRRSDD